MKPASVSFMVKPRLLMQDGRNTIEPSINSKSCCPLNEAETFPLSTIKMDPNDLFSIAYAETLDGISTLITAKSLTGG